MASLYELKNSAYNDYCYWEKVIKQYENFEPAIANAKKEIDDSVINATVIQNHMAHCLTIDEKIYKEDIIKKIISNLKERQTDLDILLKSAKKQHNEAIKKKNNAYDTYNYYVNKINNQSSSRGSSSGKSSYSSGKSSSSSGKSSGKSNSSSGKSSSSSGKSGSGKTGPGKVRGYTK